MNFSDIKNKYWIKNWEGPFSLFSVRTNVLAYMTPMQEIFGTSVPHAIVISKQGITSCFLTEVELDKFSKSLSVKIQNNPSLLDRYLSEYKVIVDTLRDSIARRQNFEVIQKQVLPFASYQVALKEIANNITDKTQSEKLEESRKFSETAFFEFVGYLGQILDQRASKTQIERKYLDYIRPDEVESKLSETELKNRFNASGLYVDGKIYDLEEDEIKKIEGILLGTESFEEIKGQIAYKGKIQGKARIIKSYKDAEFNEGEILVTGMTDPRFMSLIQKSAAIVTDAGGVLCHAAIAARELKKPCIIGTNIATKLLKDGDMVEVDANKGIVKKI